jgi:hypothetical protein
MKKIVAILLLTLSFQVCLSDSRLTSKAFNARARKFFIVNMNQIDLSPLDEIEKCILRETITQGLDSLSDSPLVILYDRYLLKHYRQPFLELGFTFVEDMQDNKFYFLCLPEFYKSMYGISDIYEVAPNGRHKLKAPREAIKFNNLLFKNFTSLSDLQVTVTRADYDPKIIVLQSLIEYSFPELNCSNIEVYEFEKKMKESLELGWVSESSYEGIMKILDNESSRRFVASDAYFVNGVGYLLFHYYLNKKTSLMNFDIYFIPERERGFVTRAQPYSYNYPNCK